MGKLLPLIVCSSTAAWWGPPYPLTSSQVLGVYVYLLGLRGYAVTGDGVRC